MDIRACPQLGLLQRRGVFDSPLSLPCRIHEHPVGELNPDVGLLLVLVVGVKGFHFGRENRQAVNGDVNAFKYRTSSARMVGRAFSAWCIFFGFKRISATNKIDTKRFILYLSYIRQKNEVA